MASLNIIIIIIIIIDATHDSKILCLFADCESWSEAFLYVELTREFEMRIITERNRRNCGTDSFITRN